MSIEKIAVTAASPTLRASACSLAEECMSENGIRVITVRADALTEVKKKEPELFEKGPFSSERQVILCDAVPSEDGRYESFSSAEERDSYGAVFFITEKGAAADASLLSTWVGTPHLRVTDTEGLRAELFAFLGIPRPLEIERKFLIRRPDTDLLLKDPLCRKVPISQTYLSITDEEEVRVRSRGEGDGCLYFETVKRVVSGIAREETERRIDRKRYEMLTNGAGDSALTLEKDRYCLMYDGQYLEIDVYPFSEEYAITETELCREDEDVRFPDFIKVIREVTGEKKYKNASLAKTKSL